MPKLNKQYTLEVTVEQFLEACSLSELQEIDLLLNKYIDDKFHTSAIKKNEESFDEKWEASRNRFQERLEEKKKQYEKTLPESPENQ